jgi:hypothetical protein
MSKSIAYRWFVRILITAGVLCAGTWGWSQAPALRIFINEPRLSPFHLGIAYDDANTYNISTTGTDRKYEWARMEGGLEWRPVRSIIARIGYNRGRGQVTSMTERFAVGTSIRLWRHEVYYAYAPFGKHDKSHYLSFAYRF